MQRELREPADGNAGADTAFNTCAVAPTMPALELRDVHKQFGATTVIQGCNLQVAAGERVAIIGPNGAGKSTLFNLISGRFAPTQGDILLHGRRINGLAPHRIHRLGVARSFQVTHVFPKLSVQENLRCAVLWNLGYGYSLFKRLSKLADVNARVGALLETLGLAAQQHQPAMDLNYADLRALELGMALASDASVLLLDEPTSGMGVQETRHFTRLIETVSRGKTLLMVEHDMDVVFELADKVAVLVYGEFIAFDTPERVRADPRVQAAYLGALDAEGQGA
jgi:branched-chain amino acid transport system ATP-binding protein